MAVRAQTPVAAFVAILAAGLVANDVRAEPLSVSNGGNNLVGKRAPNAPTRHGASVGSSHPTSLRNGAQVANATREFDLSKLTMADFGDVDPGR